MTGKYLITTDGWFYAPDGKQYRAVWGEVTIVEDDILGIKINRNSSNWFARVGTEDKHVIVAGCQIHYASRSEKRPNISDVEDLIGNGDRFDRPTAIYIAE